MKKLFSILLTLGILVGCCACSGESDTYTVGICQLMQHDALDAATRGFRDALTAELGDKVKFDEQNAAGDSNACSTIVNSFVSKNVDLIMANATPALQSAAAATTEIPILGTSVTEYGVALDIENFNGITGRNISGTSDLAPLEDQAAMIFEWLPDAKNISLVYCSGEANSKYQVDVVKAELEKRDGVTATLFSFSDSNDMAQVVTRACVGADAIYVPTDNTVANGKETVYGVVKEKNIPVFAGEEGICGGCGIATLSISYYDIGYKTGEMAAKILTGQSKISEMKIEYAPKFTKKYNKKICEELGITPPDGYVEIQ